MKKHPTAIALLGVVFITIASILLLEDPLGIAGTNAVTAIRPTSVQTCNGAEVTAIHVADMGQGETARAPTDLTITYGSPPERDSQASGAVVKVVAFGPLLPLDSQHSEKVIPEVTCKQTAIALVAHLVPTTNPELLSTIEWRGRIEVDLTLHQPQVVFESTWLMDAGEPYPYVIPYPPPWPTITKTIKRDALQATQTPQIAS